MKPTQYTARKYDGDCPNSWAVFTKLSLRGVRAGIVFYGDAEPVMVGMDRSEAQRVATRMTRQAAEKG